jgi:hypothetical protein
MDGKQGTLMDGLQSAADLSCFPFSLVFSLAINYFN